MFYSRFEDWISHKANELRRIKKKNNSNLTYLWKPFWLPPVPSSSHSVPHTPTWVAQLCSTLGQIYFENSKSPLFGSRESLPRTFCSYFWRVKSFESLCVFRWWVILGGKDSSSAKTGYIRGIHTRNAASLVEKILYVRTIMAGPLSFHFL